MEIAIDSSGLKISGEGEWKAKIHGREKRRGWIKLHIAVDPKSGELIAVDVTNEKTADCQASLSLIRKSPKTLKKVYADGAYDRKNCRETLFNQGIEQCIPLRRGGKVREGTCFEDRNDALKVIQAFGGDQDALEIWKKLSGYHKRSLSETVFSKFKGIFGDRLANKKFINQDAETIFKCHVLNRMLQA